MGKPHSTKRTVYNLRDSMSGVMPTAQPLIVML
jgi:hypothetical protein